MGLIELGQWITVHHQKPWKRGAPVRMRGMCTAFDGRHLTLHRMVDGPGRRYDGFPARHQRGDWGTIELIRDSWIARRRYFRANGSLIGELYNVQTPTSFHLGEVRYGDLEIDVARHGVSGRTEVEIQDEDDLEELTRLGHIPERLARVARAIAYELAHRLAELQQCGPEVWDVRPMHVGYGAMPQLAVAPALSTNDSAMTF